MENKEKHIFSVSQMRMYCRCPLQYYWRYCMGVKVPPSSSMLVGKSCHKAIEENNRQKITSRKDLVISDLIDHYCTEYNKTLGQEEVKFDDDPGKVKDSGIGLLIVYLQKIAPKVQPIAVEEHCCISFDSPVEYGFQGYLDLITEQNYIVDTKTAGKKYSDDAAQYDLQLTAYDVLYRTTRGKIPAGVQFHVLVKGSARKEPTVQILSGTTRTERQISRFLKTLALIAQSIKSGIFYPNDQSIVKPCSYCGYFDLCKKW
ncbi:MAG: hypothetical protein A2252_00110 [Elusimicrobia bacterium RIFOXYA2_FULL_39_19]|nr:MAG: hypothetical protein A2252_00110 [Elusimicrobia bacterium RIFOXYA2_FULL_39_19]